MARIAAGPHGRLTGKGRPSDGSPSVAEVDDPVPTFASSVSFGLLFALFHMGAHIPPGMPWDDVEDAAEHLATLGLLERGTPGGRPTPRAQLCELLRPHLSEGFVEKPSPQDIILLFALVILSAEAYGDDPESWAAAVSLPGWLGAVVTEAAARAENMPPDLLINRLDS